MAASAPSTNKTSPTPDGSDGETAKMENGGTGRLRKASIKFLESSPPSGMWHATGTTLAQAPTPMDIRRGEYGHEGWDGELQRKNSIISHESGRLSKLSSSAQTPSSLSRSRTGASKIQDERDGGAATRSSSTAAPKVGGTGQAIPMKPRARSVKIDEKDLSDEDDPFAKFIGRDRIQGQSYVRNAGGAKAAKAASPDRKFPEFIEKKGSNPGSGPGSDFGSDSDSLDELEDRPKRKRTSVLPNKFMDPDDKNSNVSKEPTAVVAPRKSRSLDDMDIKTSMTKMTTAVDIGPGPDAEGFYPNGYRQPPKHTWAEATKIGLKAFWKFTWTPFGFLVVLYGLNVVAWGGQLFLLLIGGGNQFMCFVPGEPGVKDCDNINSPRRKWIEYDSQILTALFCVTGFGLIPWRFRDLYYLLKFRLGRDKLALRRLAGIHRSWFRLPGSQNLDPSYTVSAIHGQCSNIEKNRSHATTSREYEEKETNDAIPWPITKAPAAPPTGIRARDTSTWKLDFVIWAYIANTALQSVLCGFMWGMNRYNRPSWATGLFVALACIVAAMGGLMCFLEGKRIKAVEGVPVADADADANAGTGVQNRSKSERDLEQQKVGKR